MYVQTATASVRIVVLDVNDNKPQLIIEAVQFEARRERGYLVTTVTVRFCYYCCFGEGV